ncbi:uncharacterized protein SAPINGB_P000308 [Magnusiomyces paraingens]|uniref:Uncharacterized protein n=1 Tax=Magnusiomyces paraingens TaxID=2606893 RepID=A0A5E8AY45_9ASCO|nr:uncharacterized protein SAPINGB_P000308 [Saprochaete ingens]VVT44113.1 unnamed protein product [Saprochaete ingens]
MSKPIKLNDIIYFPDEFRSNELSETEQDEKILRDDEKPALSHTDTNLNHSEKTTTATTTFNETRCVCVQPTNLQIFDRSPVQENESSKTPKIGRSNAFPQYSSPLDSSEAVLTADESLRNEGSDSNLLNNRMLQLSNEDERNVEGENINIDWGDRVFMRDDITEGWSMSQNFSELGSIEEQVENTGSQEEEESSEDGESIEFEETLDHEDVNHEENENELMRTRVIERETHPWDNDGMIFDVTETDAEQDNLQINLEQIDQLNRQTIRQWFVLEGQENVLRMPESESSMSVRSMNLSSQYQEESDDENEAWRNNGNNNWGYADDEEEEEVNHANYEGDIDDYQYGGDAEDEVEDYNEDNELF